MVAMASFNFMELIRELQRYITHGHVKCQALKL